MGANLVLTLANTTSADVLAPSDVLTAVFFKLSGNPTLTPLSAVLSSNSVVLFPPSGTGADPGGVVGGEWAYANGIAGPSGANQGISSSGLNIFGQPSFPGSNLQGPTAVDGLQYGISSAGDNPSTGNSAVKGANALIKNSVTFTLALPSSYILDPSEISDVVFQYGTSSTEPTVPGVLIPSIVVPEPSALTLVALSIGLLVALQRARRL